MCVISVAALITFLQQMQKYLPYLQKVFTFVHNYKATHHFFQVMNKEKILILYVDTYLICIIYPKNSSFNPLFCASFYDAVSSSEWQYWW
jgi:hypothetical protein